MSLSNAYNLQENTATVIKYTNKFFTNFDCSWNTDIKKLIKRQL